MMPDISFTVLPFPDYFLFYPVYLFYLFRQFIFRKDRYGITRKSKKSLTTGLKKISFKKIQGPLRGKPMDEKTIQKLIGAAKEAREKAYCPYSKFKVGAALLSESGSIFTGVNVENASYGLTNCAERTAIFKAVSEGIRKFKAIAIVLDAPDFGAPCGACRQVIYEFGPETEVIMATVSGKYKVMKIKDLIPLAFGPENL